MGENDRVRQPTKLETLRSAIIIADRDRRVKLDALAKEERVAASLITADVTTKVGAIGRDLKSTLDGLRERKIRDTRQIERDYDMALRHAQGERDARLHNLATEIDAAMGIARDANAAAVAPLEVELADRKADLAAEMRARYAAIDGAHAAITEPLVAELCALEATITAKMAATEAKAAERASATESGV